QKVSFYFSMVTFYFSADIILKTYLHNEIYTFASLSAKDFFLKNGFELIRENKVIKEGQNLKKFLMKKDVVYKN
ncbi:hypothetical protein WL263_001720, partial [Campylobacter jejuni]